MRTIFIDNFDLFTNSLAHEFENKGCEVIVLKNNIDLKQFDSNLKKFKADVIVISDGPGSLENSGNSASIIRAYAGKIPIFGIGLGHYCIISAFEGSASKTPILHGKSVKITHDGKTIFKKIKNPFTAGVYSSMSALEVPYAMEVSARYENDNVIGIRHKEYFIEGINFHPESLLTVSGSAIIDNLIDEVKGH